MWLIYENKTIFRRVCNCERKLSTFTAPRRYNFLTVSSGAYSSLLLCLLLQGVCIPGCEPTLTFTTLLTVVFIHFTSVNKFKVQKR